MRTISSILLLLLCTAGWAHEKHISTLTIATGASEAELNIRIKLHLPDYTHCSRAGQTGFEQWIGRQIVLVCDTDTVQMQMTKLAWGHDIVADFEAIYPTNASQLDVRSKLFVGCLPSHKTIVAAQLDGENYGRVLNAQTDTCAFPLRK
jgi:hypothetical protein